MLPSSFANSVYRALVKVPAGRITTYKELARATGRPLAARAVGNILNKNPHAPRVPCHRVILSSGKVGGFAGGQAKKKALLRAEGIEIKNNKIQHYREVLFSF